LKPSAISSRSLRALVVSILVAAGGYLAFSLWGGWREVVTAASQVGAWGMAIALLLSLLNYLLRFVRWHYYLHLLGHRIAVARNLRIYLAGFALTTTPGKAGEMVRSVFLAGDGVSYSASIAAFFSERLSDLMAVVLLAALGLVLYPAGKPFMVAVVVVVAVVMLILHRPQWLHGLRDRFLVRLPGGIARIASGGIDTALHAGKLFRWTPLLAGLALGLVAWGAEAYAFYLMAHWMGQPLDLPGATFIYSFAVLAGALSFLPGGLGGAEAVMVALLVLKGVATPTAIALTVLIRLATLWFAVALGVGALLGADTRRR
jgi:uncharacterized membrane protein YbhN (UPF0104 family)